MPRKQDDWLTSQEAARILTASSGHDVSSDYVRQLGRIGKLTIWQVDKRTKLYLKSDVESYRVEKRGDGSVRRAMRKPKQQAA